MSNTMKVLVYGGPGKIELKEIGSFVKKCRRESTEDKKYFTNKTQICFYNHSIIIQIKRKNYERKIRNQSPGDVSI